MKKKTLAFKDISSKANGVILPKSVFVPILGKEKKYYQVHYKSEKFYVKKSKLKRKSRKYCSVNPKCFRLKKNSSIYRRPSFKSEKLRVHKKGEEVNWTGQRSVRYKKRKVRWYQVISEGEYSWVPAFKGQLSEGSCVEDKDRKRFFVEADYGYMMSVNSDDYSYLLTSIPNPSSVACLQNPIVDSVDAGSGHRVGGNTTYQLLPWLGLRAGVHFETLTYQVNTLENPHPDPGNTSCALLTVNKSSLSSSQFTIKENNLVFPIGAFYPMRLGRNHHIMLSAHFNSIYNLKQEQSFQFFTGQTLSKQTENSRAIGVDTFRTSFDLELKYIYNWPLEKGDFMGVSISVKQLQNSQSFGVGILL